MSILEGMNFRKWTRSCGTASMEVPAHWTVDSASALEGAVRFAAPADDDVWLEAVFMPYSVPGSLYTSQADLLSMLDRALQHEPGTELLGRADVFVYPACAARSDKGTLLWAAMHMDRVVIFLTGGVPQQIQRFSPVFERMLQSFRLHLSEESEVAMLLGEVLHQLAQAVPESSPKFAGDHLVMGSLQIRVDNLAALIRRSPNKRAQLIREFVLTTAHTFKSCDTMATESWRAVRNSIYPMVRPEAILHQMAPAESGDLSAADQVRAQMMSTPWLDNLVICYAIDSEKTLRFVQNHDLERWGLDADVVKRQAMHNMSKVKGPVFSTMRNDKVDFLVAEVTDNGLPSRSCWILHPELHKSLERVFRGPSWVAVPSRDSLMAFSANPLLRAGLQNRLSEDYRTTGHSISDRLFEVRADGVVLA
jgi:uncharacterized protein YtpQ (UPF0354 family)